MPFNPGGRDVGVCRGQAMAEARLCKPPTLHRRKDFLRVQGEGKRFKEQHLVLLIAAGAEVEAQVGYTVSRRVGNAVVRNRVRRRLREIVRVNQEMLREGLDYVIIALPSAKTASFASLREELRCLLGRADAWASVKRSSSL